MPLGQRLVIAQELLVVKSRKCHYYYCTHEWAWRR